MSSSGGEEKPKKQTPPVQNSTPSSSSAKNIKTIEQQVDLKYLQLERNKLPPEEQREIPPAPQEPAPVSHKPMISPAAKKEMPASTASEEPLATPHEELEETNMEEPSEVFESPMFDELDKQEKKSEEQHTKPVTVKKRLGFRKRHKKTKPQPEQYTEHAAHVIKQQDRRGKPVFLEDTGEKLGVITDTVYDENKNIIGYKIKTDDADTAFSFPAEQFSEDKQGFLFTPNWYQNALETIEKLEFNEKISPEVSSLVQDGMFNEELYDLLLKRDDEFVNKLEDALLLKEILVSQIKLLEERRVDLTAKANTLVTKRLIEDVDRKQFSEHVQELRRKIKLLDLNIQKCNELLQRLTQTSVGAITKYVTQVDEGQPDYFPEQLRKTPKKTHRPAREYRQDHEPTLTELIAELIEEKIVDDIKKQLIRNKMPQRYDHAAGREDRGSQTSFDEDDEDEWDMRRQDALRKRRQRFR